MLYQRIEYICRGYDCFGQEPTSTVSSVRPIVQNTGNCEALTGGIVSCAGPAARLQQMLRGQRLPPIPHLLSVMVQPKQVSTPSTLYDIRVSSKELLLQHPNTVHKYLMHIRN